MIQKSSLLLIFLLLLLDNCQSFSPSLSFSSSRYWSKTQNNLILNHNKAQENKDGIDEPQVLFRNEYKKPAYLVKQVKLDFNFSETTTRVSSELTIVPNEKHDKDCSRNNLILNGDTEKLSLISIKHKDNNGNEREFDYHLFAHNETLVISSQTLSSLIISCTLEIVVDLTPRENKELSGLYFRDNMYCTHCEPCNFRQLTFYPDRPDNCAVFDTVRIEADQDKYPILLSNGNLQETGQIPAVGGNASRHYAIFHDPHPKPSYLFGLVVASNHILGSLRDSYTTKSGHEVELVIYGEHNQIPKLTFAMDTLKNAMQWDEDTYGLEYDLNSYTIVAAQHFTIGAMENKGLNLFMTSLIATDPSCTTDVTYDLVEKTIAHEYFHNWSGNRVTLQNWFEFTLKEGLTVYRDQEFTASFKKIATRIEAVKILREKQFAEDADHIQRTPIRPERYLSRKHNLDALATSTAYHKGAEVFRMYETILSKDGFRDGFNLYIKRHDGTGATCDDFHSAMSDANPDVDLIQFRNWYSTAGTPTVFFSYHHNDNQQFKLTLSQKVVNDENDDNTLLHIPVAVGLLDKNTGEEIVSTVVLHLKERTQTFVFDDLPTNNGVVPSLLRDFSAPVYLMPSSDHQLEEPEEEQRLAFLAAHDTDGFNKWEATQELYARYIYCLMTMTEVKKKDRTSVLEQYVMTAFGRALRDADMGPSSKAYLLNLPSEFVLSRGLDTIKDPIRLLDARKEVMQRIAQTFSQDIQREHDALTSIVAKATTSTVITNAKSRAHRALRNQFLEYLCSMQQTSSEQEIAAQLAMKHYDTAVCFTDQFLAFRQLVSMSSVRAASYRDEVTHKFYKLAKESNNNVIMNKFFQVQALADVDDALELVQALTKHPDFRAPGRFRALIASFTMNTRAFHTQNGYRFIGNIIRQMDKQAPSLAVELANKLASWSKYEGTLRSEWMKEELHQIKSALGPSISESLLETVTRALPKDYQPHKNNKKDKAKMSDRSKTSNNDRFGGKKREKKSNKKKNKQMATINKKKKGFS